MITGLEYVLIAYSIWICTFVVYIFVNKKRKNNLEKTISAVVKTNLVSKDRNPILEKNEG